MEVNEEHSPTQHRKWAVINRLLVITQNNPHIYLYSTLLNATKVYDRAWSKGIMYVLNKEEKTGKKNLNK